MQTFAIFASRRSPSLVKVNCIASRAMSKSIDPATHREEHDSMGVIPVPHDCYYGAQTARALQNFHIGEERMPVEVIRAIAQVKKACAMANRDLGRLTDSKCQLICQAADDIISGEKIPYGKHFPLSVWQTGSGTQTHMNVNEVIVIRATEMVHGERAMRQEARPLHPNDDVNLSQSSNDVFPTAMNLAAVNAVHAQLLPALRSLHAALHAKANEFADIVKIGRTHMQDATPLTLGQEISGYAAMVSADLRRVEQALDGLQHVAIGGTAVGTGLNAHLSFAGLVCAHLTALTGHAVYAAENPFAAVAAHSELVAASGALKTLATSLLKIANDVRWLGSGPRCGLNELSLPSNEPGSSIMPGKVNPTQCEALAMVSVQVMALDAAIATAGSQGNLELNTYKPLMIHDFLCAVRLLSDSTRSFAEHCVRGIVANRAQIERHVQRSLMLVTALSPHLGYDKCALIAHKAASENLTLREAAVQLQFVTADEFDRWVVPADMTHP